MPLSDVQGLVQLGINLGFAATMCLLLFVAYKQLASQFTNRLADIVEKNTVAMTSLINVIDALCDRFDRSENRDRSR